MSPDSSIKERIYAFIGSHPGSYFREILRSVNVGTGNLQYILFMLEQEGKITARRNGFYKYFYPSDMSHEKNKNILSILSQESLREILVFLTQKPGPSQKEIAKLIRCSSPTASWHLRRLEALELVWSRKEGMERKYYSNISVRELSELLKKYRPAIWNKYADRMADIMRVFEKDAEGDDQHH